MLSSTGIFVLLIVGVFLCPYEMKDAPNSHAVMECKHVSGVAPGIFRWGADSSDEWAKIGLSGYYKCQKSP